MIIKVWMTYRDGQDGSFNIVGYPTKEDALEHLDRTEEQLSHGSFYEDGAMEEIEMDVDPSTEKLLNSFSMSVG